MTAQTITSCLFIALGSIVMLFSIIKFSDILKAVPFIPEKHRKTIRRYLFMHRGLMIFFLFGYIAVLISFIARHSPASEIAVGVIFLFSAVFIFSGRTFKPSSCRKST